MARVQYRVEPMMQEVVGKAIVNRGRAVIRERPGAGYAARLRKRQIGDVVRLCGGQRKAAEVIRVSLGKLQRMLRKDV